MYMKDLKDVHGQIGNLSTFLKVENWQSKFSDHKCCTERNE